MHMQQQEVGNAVASETRRSLAQPNDPALAPELSHLCSYTLTLFPTLTSCCP